MGDVIKGPRILGETTFGGHDYRLVRTSEGCYVLEKQIRNALEVEVFVPVDRLGSSEEFYALARMVQKSDDDLRKAYDELNEAGL